MADRDQTAPGFWVKLNTDKDFNNWKKQKTLDSGTKASAPGYRESGAGQPVYVYFDKDFYPVEPGQTFSSSKERLTIFLTDCIQNCSCVTNIVREFKWIKENETSITNTNVEMRWVKRDMVDCIERKGTRDELMDEFNRQVIYYKAHYQELAQESRMLDKSAAMLIAGAACVSVRGNVWVDCNMESEWFDSSDEKNLMRFAWSDVIGKDTATSAENFARLSGNSLSQLADDHDPRLTYITRVLKSFRKTQLTMQLYSLSPGTEAALSTLVIDAMNQFPSLSAFGDSDALRYKIRSTVSEHDDKIRRMARILRRIPFTRNEFCRVAGNTLRYNISLQEGVAISTRRLNQIQVDMRHAVGVWLQFLNENIDRILYEVMHCWNNDESFYVFDWTTHRLKILDSEQYGIDVPSFNLTVEEEVMFQQSCGDRTCKWEDTPFVNADGGSEGQTSAVGRVPRINTSLHSDEGSAEEMSKHGKVPRKKTLHRTVSPYVFD